MQLRCPKCLSPVQIPDRLSRYFGMPVACHLCRHVFAVPPQSPVHDKSPAHDSGVPRHLIAPLDRSVSAMRSSHERRCPSCRRSIRLPGPDPAIGPLGLLCPYCQARFTLHSAGGIRPLPLATVLGVGIMLGLAVLWLDRQGLIALRQIELTERLLDAGRILRQWTAWRH